MSERKLTEVLAVEKGAKGRAESHLKIGYQQAGHTELFDGMSRTYVPFVDDGIDYPAETKNVQVRAKDILGDARKTLDDLWNVTAAKDLANCNAKADIVVDGQTVAQGVPSTYLLFLEKQLLNIRALVAKLPILDEAVKWDWDEQTQLFRSSPTKVHRTKKVQKPLVLLEPTKEHPGKAEVITEDVPVGTYENVRFSGAIRVQDKKVFSERIEKLERAVKQARERANMVTAPEVDVAAGMLEYIFG